MNTITLVAKIAQNAQVKNVGQTTIAQFSVEDTTGYGEKTRRSFLPVKVWGKKAQALGNYLTSGKTIYITGTVVVEEWQNQQGQKQRATVINANDISFIGGQNKQDMAGQENQDPDNQPPFQSQAQQGPQNAPQSNNYQPGYGNQGQQQNCNGGPQNQPGTFDGNNGPDTSGNGGGLW